MTSETFSTCLNGISCKPRDHRLRMWESMWIQKIQFQPMNWIFCVWYFYLCTWRNCMNFFVHCKKFIGHIILRLFLHHHIVSFAIIYLCSPGYACCSHSQKKCITTEPARYGNNRYCWSWYSITGFSGSPNWARDAEYRTAITRERLVLGRSFRDISRTFPRHFERYQLFHHWVCQG